MLTCLYFSSPENTSPGERLPDTEGDTHLPRGNPRGQNTYEGGARGHQLSRGGDGVHTPHTRGTQWYVHRRGGRWRGNPRGQGGSPGQGPYEGGARGHQLSRGGDGVHTPHTRGTQWYVHRGGGGGRGGGGIPWGRARMKVVHVDINCHEEETGYTPLIHAVLNGTYTEGGGGGIPGGRVRMKMVHVDINCHEEETGYTPLIHAVLNGTCRGVIMSYTCTQWQDILYRTTSMA